MEQIECNRFNGQLVNAPDKDESLSKHWGGDENTVGISEMIHIVIVIQRMYDDVLKRQNIQIPNARGKKYDRPTSFRFSTTMAKRIAMGHTRAKQRFR